MGCSTIGSLQQGNIMRNGEYILVKAPDWFKGKRYRNRYCYEHHLVWEKETGLSVPNGCIIHHKDGDKHNNNFDNLQLMTNQNHAAFHSKKGRAFYKLKCPYCGKIFEREKRICGYGRRLVFCSRHCVGKMFCFPMPTKEKLQDARDSNIIEEFIRR